jgi:putative Holliday junction resolvase
MNMSADDRIIALDVGTKRIGVASAGVVARLAAPLKTLVVTDDILDQIKALVAEQNATGVVVGLPRDMQGSETAQTASTRAFAQKLRQVLTIPVYLIDEAVTSRQAEAELASRKSGFAKGDIDALAATYILEDFLHSGVV